jgi:hypothetical protein
MNAIVAAEFRSSNEQYLRPRPCSLLSFRNPKTRRDRLHLPGRINSRGVWGQNDFAEVMQPRSSTNMPAGRG